MITDFYSYNTNVSAIRGEDSFGWFEPHWVGDLTLSFQLEPKSASGEVVVELVEGGRLESLRARPESRETATLFHGDRRSGSPRLLNSRLVSTTMSCSRTSTTG